MDRACTAGILLVAAGGVYVGMTQKYKTRFFPNTQINGVDASGKDSGRGAGTDFGRCEWLHTDDR